MPDRLHDPRSAGIIGSMDRSSPGTAVQPVNDPASIRDAVPKNACISDGDGSSVQQVGAIGVSLHAEDSGLAPPRPDLKIGINRDRSKLSFSDEHSSTSSSSGSAPDDGEAAAAHDEIDRR